METCFKYFYIDNLILPKFIKEIRVSCSSQALQGDWMQWWPAVGVSKFDDLNLGLVLRDTVALVSWLRGSSFHFHWHWNLTLLYLWGFFFPFQSSSCFLVKVDHSEQNGFSSLWLKLFKCYKVIFHLVYYEPR